MKLLYAILLLMIVSCAPKVRVQKELLSQEVLVNKVLKELQLDQFKTHLYDIKPSPYNLNEAILVLAEEEDVEEDRERYTSYIILVNSSTGNIINYISENSTQNGWISDAIFINEISIDTAKYELSETKKAFGVVVKFKNNSQPNPYQEHYISLFVNERYKIEKVLNSYSIYKSEAIVNINQCYSDFNITKSKLLVSSSKTNKYYNILLAKTVVQKSFREDKNGECSSTEKILAKEEEVLKFNREQYQ